MGCCSKIKSSQTQTQTQNRQQELFGRELCERQLQIDSAKQVMLPWISYSGKGSI